MEKVQSNSIDKKQNGLKYPRVSKRRIYYICLWGQLSTAGSNTTDLA